tara:strand:+ start:695 stop:973 length:279 start_codon:yes stop_codon:yes gene_type:complete
MSAWLTFGIVLVVIFLVTIKISGKTAKELGRVDERRRSLERDIKRVDTAFEKLSEPLPDRPTLARRWLFRIRKARALDESSSMSDSDDGNGH